MLGPERDSRRKVSIGAKRAISGAKTGSTRIKHKTATPATALGCRRRRRSASNLGFVRCVICDSLWAAVAGVGLVCASLIMIPNYSLLLQPDVEPLVIAPIRVEVDEAELPELHVRMADL